MNKMMTRRDGVQMNLFSTTLEEVVPSGHFLRQLETAVDWKFIYDELAPYYSDIGRASIDPIVIIKSLLIGFLYGINSERRLEDELNYNVAYRWFLGLSFDEKVPDHSAVSQLRRRKFNDADLTKKLFMRVLELCAENGLVSGRLLVTDSSHVKANASKTSKIRIEIERQTTDFFEQLDTYEAAERAYLGMPEITRKPPEPKVIEQTVSTTDPEAGWLVRPDKPEGFHFLSHQTIDAENGIIVDVTVTPGNTPDCNPYINQINRAVDTLDKLDIEVKAVSADSAYDTVLIHKKLEEHGLAVSIPKKETSDNSKTEYKRTDFTYSQESDNFLCPGGNTLTLRTLQRTETGVYREYRADAKACNICLHREKCLAPSQKSRKIQVNIFQHISDMHHANDGSADYNDALRKRQIWCEGTFAIQKARHNLRQLFRRGIRAASDHCLLSACAVNLKRLVKANVLV